MKKLLKMIALSAICSAQASELDDLINTSAVLANKIDGATQLVGAAITHSNMGYVTEDGIVDPHLISVAEVQAYNQALSNMSYYQPYGDAQTFLEDKAAEEIELMNDAVDTFTEATIKMSTVIEVADMAETASTPNEEKAVQDYVQNNVETLTIDQGDVDDFNQSLQDIETHANNAGAYLGVAQSKEATEFLNQGAEDNGTHFDVASISYSSNMQWVQVDWANNTASAVYINGNNWGLDLYVSAEDAYFAGQQSEFYEYSPSNYFGEYQ